METPHAWKASETTGITSQELGYEPMRMTRYWIMYRGRSRRYIFPLEALDLW